MKNKLIILLVAASVLYVLFHLVTLTFSPIPWFDEVSFVSMTESYIKDHTFYETPRILVLPEEKLNYGPIYFILQSWVLKAFGFSMFNFRMTGLLFGFIDLFLLYKICKRFGFTMSAAIVTILFVCLEPNFNQFLHSGRMDFLMLFFYMSAYLLFSKIDNANKNKVIMYSLLIGALLSCSLLSNPRIVFAFSSFVCFFIYEMITFRGEDRKWALIKYLLIASSFIALYIIWILSAYGSFKGYIYHNFENSAVMNEHVGIGTFIRPNYNMIVYLYAIVAFFILIKNKILTKHVHLAVLCFPAIIAFLLIVTGGISGRYYTLVAPFAALLIVGVTVSFTDTKVLKYVTYTICFLFGCAFTFKSVYILSTMAQRNPNTNEKIISKYLTRNTSVVGDFQYYYIARSNGCSFLSIEVNGDDYDTKWKQFLDRKTKYFIINKANFGLSQYDDLLINNHYKMVADIKSTGSPSFLSAIMKKLPYAINDNYACQIYEYQGQ